LCRPLIVTVFTLLGVSAGHAQETDLGEIKSQIEEMKKQYESRIENLEKRIESLEADNTRLKHQTKAKPTEGTSEEVAALKNRVHVLETNARETSTATAATTQRSAANAEAIQQLEKDLHSDDTETQDLYRDDGGWPFDVTKLYDLPRPFEFHGYLRSGFGLTDQGGKMEAFKGPGQ
jgi:maltoporin